MIAALPEKPTVLPRLGLGTWALAGNGWPRCYGPQDDMLSVETIRTALDFGVTLVDTAPVYGFGTAETIVGRVIADRRDDVFLVTKCGNRWGDDRRVRHHAAPKLVRGDVTESLRRLGVDAVDLLLIHVPPEDVSCEEAWEGVCTLREEGWARFVGVSNFNLDQLAACHRIAPVDAVQEKFGLLSALGEPERHVTPEVLDFCERERISVLGYGALGHGMLAATFDSEGTAPDDWRRASHLEDLRGAAHEIVERLTPLAEIAGLSTLQLAAAWAVAVPQIDCVLIGARSPAQFEEVASAVQMPLDPEIKNAIDVMVARRHSPLTVGL